MPTQHEFEDSNSKCCGEPKIGGDYGGVKPARGVTSGARMGRTGCQAVRGARREVRGEAVSDGGGDGDASQKTFIFFVRKS